MPRHNELERDNSSPQNLEVLEYTSIWDDLGITFFLKSAVARKRLLWLVPIFWIAISNFWFLLSQDEYQGELQVIPASTGMTSARSAGLGSLLGGSGLGGLFGGSTNDSMFSVYTESWTAPWFAQDLLENQDLSRRIFSGQWSAETKTWRTSSGGPGSWVRFMFGARYHPRSTPNTDQMLAFLNQNIKIQHNRTDVMTFVTFENRDPGLVRDLLTYGHKRITDHMRQIYQQRAQDSVTYLLNELQHVSVTEYRNSLIDELAQQEKIRMMAYANQQFVAQSFGVYVTDSPVWPRLGLILMGSLVLSFIAYAACIIAASKHGALAALRSLWGLLPTSASEPIQRILNYRKGRSFLSR